MNLDIFLKSESHWLVSFRRNNGHIGSRFHPRGKTVDGILTMKVEDLEVSFSRIFEN